MFPWRNTFLLKDVELKLIFHVSVTAKMEALQELQFSPEVSHGLCYCTHRTYNDTLFCI